MIALRLVTPPKINTGVSPMFSAIDDVNIFMKLPVDWLKSRRLFAIPRFSGIELFATRVVLRILKAPKLTPDRKRTSITVV
jgi:hypothetical protein